MGGAQSSGSSHTGKGSAEEDLENKFRGTGDLAILERAFSHLSASSSSGSSSPGKHGAISADSLQTALGLSPLYINESAYPEFCEIIPHVGPAVGKEFFTTENVKEISWEQFLSGFQKCTQTSGGKGLQSLFSVFSQATQVAKGSESKILEKSPGETGSNLDMVGYLTGAQLRNFLWLCWLLMCSSRLPAEAPISKLEAFLPTVDSLLAGAVSACDTSKSEDGSTEESGLNKELPLNEVTPWALATAPGLTDCLLQFVRAKLQRIPVSHNEESGQKNVEGAPSNSEPPKEAEGLEEGMNKSKMLLQSGVALSIGLSLRDSVAERLFTASCGLMNNPADEFPNLLYRSSLHGKGMSRFWSSVQGYQGPTLFLVSAHAPEETEHNSQDRHFVLGGLLPGGFDNKETFYGASGSYLFAVAPTYVPLHSTGREKNFVYSHKNAPGTGYRAKPKAEGLGFGGSSGKERIWLNEDFEALTVRHHAVDKTYQSGSLVPKQGYGEIKAKVTDVEVWGLGGKSADDAQAIYSKRENLFSEQRRKVDLKTMFGTWENSPEKMMMDMVSNPNAPQREER